MTTPLPILRPILLAVALPLAVLAVVHALGPASPAPAAAVAAPAPLEPAIPIPGEGREPAGLEAPGGRRDAAVVR